MWPNFDGKPYSHDALIAHVNALDFSHWHRKDGSVGRPKFIVLHNTSEPTIKLWLSWDAGKRLQYIHNMQPYYERMGWRAGPHYFVPPQTDIAAWGFSDPVTAGTHASCFNSDSIGIEMVGEFNDEAFDSGSGSLVRDNAVFLMALLHNKLGLRPDGYIYGARGLHFHIECHADNHDCPGRNVHKPDVIARVINQMNQLGNPAAILPLASANAPAPDAPTQRGIKYHLTGKCSWFGGKDDTGVAPNEGLGPFADEASMRAHGLGDYLVSAQAAGAPGLARRLDPQKLYLACRWNVADYPFLRDAVAHVRNPANGREVLCRPVDWGPNARTGRVADLSPGALGALGLQTDGVCEVTVYQDGK